MTEAEILAMISELNKIEVRGEQNLDTLLACIGFLKNRASVLKEKRVRAEREAQEQEVTPLEEKDG